MGLECGPDDITSQLAAMLSSIVRQDRNNIGQVAGSGNVSIGQGKTS
jgi:hypothetical protein